MKSKIIHKYRSNKFYDIVSKCGVRAWKCGTQKWKRVTCKKCLNLKKSI